MKYIRTNDGNIFEKKIEHTIVYYANKNYTSYFYNEQNGLSLNDFFKERGGILTQANNIKDLCDGFIITSKQGHIYDSYGDYGYELKEVLPQAREECPDEDWDLYGCILVDGIIKQVAKLNDEKGELELMRL